MTKNAFVWDMDLAEGGVDSSPPTEGTDLPRARGRGRESASLVVLAADVGGRWSDH